MDPRKLTDEELVRLLLSTQDENLRAELWVEFWRRFRPVIAGVIVKKLIHRSRWVGRSLADDLVSETFLKLCKDNFKILRNFEFRHENALPAFLKVMAAHAVEDHFRKYKIVEEELNPEIMPGPPVFPEEIDRRMKIEKIENCLQQLAGKPNFERDHKIFWLYNRDGVTAQEISQLPDLGFKTVKGVESALLRLNRWVLQCVQGGKAKKSSSGPGSVS